MMPFVGDEQARVSFSTPNITEADVEAVVRVLRSGWLTTGRECARFEGELADFLGVNHAVAMSSCTAALETAFAALSLPAGARVGVPTWTFAASALAPLHLGARPVLLDIDAGTLNLSPEALSVELASGLDAVVAVHLGGVAVDESVHHMCADAGVPLVEDAAHALGARDHRGYVGGQGSVAACFSFYATKNLASGEGGALTTDCPDVARFARTYRLHGLSADAVDRYRTGALYDLVGPGIKANFPDVLAALARSQLSRFLDMQLRRRALVLQYRHALGLMPGLRVIPEEMVAGSADHLMLVELPAGVDRRGVVRCLADMGVGTSVHFRPLHSFAWLRQHVDIGRAGTPTADRLSARVLSLPLHAAMTVEQVHVVCDALSEALAV